STSKPLKSRLPQESDTSVSGNWCENSRRWLYWRFFFSSRRRHTSLQGDWSSDVCSSDLHAGGRLETQPGDLVGGAVVVDDLDLRSEERRVGKECRSPRAAFYFEKQTMSESQKRSR